MATPKWDALHYRLALGARDEITAPGSGDWTAGVAPDGKDFTRADRDLLLNYALQHYYTIFLKQYEDNVKLLRVALQDLVKVAGPIVGAAGVIPLTTVTDYCAVLDLIETTAVPCTRRSISDLDKIGAPINPEVAATTKQVIFAPAGSQISYIPTTFGGSFMVVYIPSPLSITQNQASPDFPLGQYFYETILNLALSRVYARKQEPELTKMYEDLMYSTSPYPIAREVQK